MTQLNTGRLEMPPVVKNLIIINVLLALVQHLAINFNVNLTDILGLHYWRSELFRPWQILTHMFMHGSPYDPGLTIMHLFSNMFGLWMFGSTLEKLWGPKRFLTFYLICGLGAAMLHLGVLAYEYHVFQEAFLNYQQNATLDKYILFIQQKNLDGIDAFVRLKSFWEKTPSCSDCSAESISLIRQYYTLMIGEGTVGASGAVFGILFAFGYIFPNIPLMLIFLPIPIKAKYFIALYAIFELSAGIKNSAGDNVAHFAHLGGMLVAFIILKIWNSKSQNRLY